MFIYETSQGSEAVRKGNNFFGIQTAPLYVTVIVVMGTAFGDTVDPFSEAKWQLT